MGGGNRKEVSFYQTGRQELLSSVANLFTFLCWHIPYMTTTAPPYGPSKNTFLCLIPIMFLTVNDTYEAAKQASSSKTLYLPLSPQDLQAC